jgi:hypothetical protein
MCSPTLAGDDEEDEVELKAGAPKHEWLRRGGMTVSKRWQWKLHDAQEVDRGKELNSGVERCGEGQGWCLLL